MMTKTMSLRCSVKIVLWMIVFGIFSVTVSAASLKTSLDDYLLDTEPYHSCLKVGDSGNIYIADQKSQYLRVFSADGKYLYSLGGRGRGPGLFQRWIGTFGIAENGDVCQVDFINGNRRITRFKADGKLIDSFPFNGSRTNGATEIHPLKNGDFLLTMVENIVTHQKNRLYCLGLQLAFVRVGEKGEVKKHLAREIMYCSFSDETQGGWPNIPFGSEYVTAYCPKTNRLAYMQTDWDKLKVLNPDTGETSEIETGLPRVKVTAEDIEHWIAEKSESNQMYKQMEHFYKKFRDYGEDIVTYKPLIKRIFFNPEGQCFVVSRGDNDEENVVRKFSPDFKPLGTLKIKNAPYYVGLEKDYYLTYDEEEDVYFLEIRDRSEFFRPTQNKG